MNQIKIMGSNVHYWIFNPNKPQTIVMVHGFRGTHHGLQSIVDQLPDYKIIVPDLPGFGDSTPMHRHSIADFSQFLHEFIQRVAPKKPILLGHSFGSIIVSYFAAEHPNAISKLILMNAVATPVLKGPSKVATKFALGYYWLAGKLPEKPARALLGNKAIVMAASVFMTKTKDRALRKKIHASHLRHFSTFQNVRTLDQVFKTSVRNTAADRAAEILVPTLLIAGEKDDIAPLKGQYLLLEKIPKAKLVTIPGVGHLTQHEAPLQVAKAIYDFLGAQKS